MKPAGETWMGLAYASPGDMAAQLSQGTSSAAGPVVTSAMPSTSRKTYGMPPEIWVMKNLSLGGGLHQQPVMSGASGGGPAPVITNVPETMVPYPTAIEHQNQNHRTDGSVFTLPPGGKHIPPRWCLGTDFGYTLLGSTPIRWHRDRNIDSQ